MKEAALVEAIALYGKAQLFFQSLCELNHSHISLKFNLLLIYVDGDAEPKPKKPSGKKLVVETLVDGYLCTKKKKKKKKKHGGRRCSTAVGRGATDLGSQERWNDYELRMAAARKIRANASNQAEKRK